MKSQNSFFRNLSSLEKTLLVILSILVFSLFCVVIMKVVSVFLSSNTQEPSSNSLPAHVVNDMADNGKTNVVYFIVADKSLNENEAKMIIEYYEGKHEGYKIINIFVFCDTAYADYDHFEELEAAGEPNDAQYWTHLSYWYYRYDWNNLQTDFITGPTVDFPSFGNACR